MERTSLPPRTRPLARSTTPIARSTKPIARSPIRKRSGTPKRWADRRCRPFLDWLKAHAVCCVPGCATPWPVDPSHVRTRAVGEYDLGGAVGKCRTHHNEYIRVKTFARKYRLTQRRLRAIALALADQFLVEHPEYLNAPRWRPEERL